MTIFSPVLTIFILLLIATLINAKNNKHNKKETEDDDDDSITVGGDSADMASFFNEILAARQQYQLMKEGRTEEIQPTEQ